MLNDVLEMQQEGEVASLKGTAESEEWDTVTFCFAKVRRGTAIHDDQVQG